MKFGCRTTPVDLSSPACSIPFEIMAGPPVPFSKLPLSKEFPNTTLNAWGAYGVEDQKGFLNRQSDDIVRKAAQSEIKTGKRYACLLL